MCAPYKIIEVQPILMVSAGVCLFSQTPNKKGSEFSPLLCHPCTNKRKFVKAHVFRVVKGGERSETIESFSPKRDATRRRIMLGTQVTK